MKPQVAPYETLCYCVRIECVNGLVVRLTDYPRPLVIGGNTYLPDSGYQFTGLDAGTNMAAAAMDLEGFVALGAVERDEVASGVFDNARMYVFATDWTNPQEDQEEIGCAILGKTTLSDDKYRIEMMALVDALGQSVGRRYQPACDKVFGSQTYAGCKVDLGAITVTGTLSHVTSRTIFRDDTRTEDADWFGAGTIRFTTGPNAGLKPLEIKRYEADGTIETFEPVYYAVHPGDEYEMIPGCRKRREDCRDKWNNILNFGGFPSVPTSSQYQKVGGQ